jgi:hypothetical protein
MQRAPQRRQAQLTRRLEGLEMVALCMDGVVVAQQTVIVALGITRAGCKEPQGLRLGSTENAVVCTELLQDLLARGLEETLTVLKLGLPPTLRHVTRNIKRRLGGPRHCFALSPRPC